MRVRNFVSSIAMFMALALIPVFSHAQVVVPHSSHVVLLMDENTSYKTALLEMPWLVNQGTANGYASNYMSNTAGSLMDYLWLSSGSCHDSVDCVLPAGTHNFQCTGDSCTSPITDDNIFREMNNLGISWKVYAQSYKAAGGTVTTPDGGGGTHYYRRHNGATWYSDILSNVAGSQAKIVDFSQFAADLANNALPQFTLIAPDGLNDAHDSTPAAADVFLKANLPALLAKPYFQPGGDALLLITFDNGDADEAGPVYTALIGPNVTPHTVSITPYTHENALRTILDALGIAAHPGGSATAAPMTEFFTGAVAVTSPAQNAVTGTQVLISASASESTKIYQLQVWDNLSGQKLGESAPNTSTFSQTVSLLPGTHQLIIEDLATGNFAVLHKANVIITVKPDGVTITSPAPNATSGPGILVNASASEIAAQIYQLQVWDNTTGQKLGESIPGTSSIQQTFTLGAGTHQLAVEDINTGTFQTLHKALVNVTVQADGVFITSQVTNSINGPVLINASAHESAATIYQLQIWDNTTGQRLGQSAPGTSTISQTLTLTPGTHQIVVEDISTGTFQALHKASIRVNVAP
jgi:phosphatidylinositol-3-phosphatase